ncbi:MAG: gluconokinase [Gammaproteobacteria bacterium]|nr:gluconokinase [Gammaproteobacteria bacterium]
MVQKRKPLIVVMGVSASGKSTVGKLLAKRLGLIYADGDAFHSRANIEKMSSGVPLNDADRRPWLDAIGLWIADWRDTGAVIACSALKRAYRDRLRAAAPGTVFLQLSGGVEELRRRVAARKDHFMPASLLDSQLETLEPLETDEAGIAIDLTLSPEAIVAAFLDYLPGHQAFPAPL